MTTLDIDRYLQRIGAGRPPAPTLAALADLQRRHNAAIPFETIDTLLRRPVAIDLDSVQRKLLHEGRGGYCYELNGLFLELLRALGFDARALSARVLLESSDAPSPRTHRLSLVSIDGVDHIVDVGFGGNTPTAPLRLDRRDPQETPHETYRLESDGAEYVLQVRIDGAWRPLYRFDLHPQLPADDEVGNWYVCTHPRSSFLGQLRVALAGPGWRRTLGNGRVGLHRSGQPSEHRPLVDSDDVIDTLQRGFGIRVPDDPGLRPAIETWLDVHR